MHAHPVFSGRRATQCWRGCRMPPGCSRVEPALPARRGAPPWRLVLRRVGRLLWSAGRRGTAVPPVRIDDDTKTKVDLGRQPLEMTGVMMSSDDTMKILERHGAAAQANELDAVMADHADD
jgi:hypothetical protein